MADETTAGNAADVPDGTPINGLDYLLLPFPPLQAAYDDMGDGTEPASTGADEAPQWLTEESNASSDPEFETFLSALRQLSLPKITLRNQMSPHISRVVEASLLVPMLLIRQVTDILNTMLDEASEKILTEPCGEKNDPRSHCFANKVDVVKASSSVDGITAASPLGIPLVNAGSVSGTTRAWHWLWFCESYDKLDAMVEQYNKQKNDPSLGTRLDIPEGEVDQGRTVFVVEVKNPCTFRASRGLDSLRARQDRPPVPVQDRYIDKVMDHLPEHRREFECDKMFVSSVLSTVGVEFVGQPKPLSTATPTTDTAPGTAAPVYQDLRFFGTRLGDKYRDPRVIFAFLGWQMARAKGVL